MKNEKIDVIQLFTLIVLFELGSAVVIGVGLEAKKDAWMPIVIGAISGILLFVLYDYILKTNPKMTFFESLKKHFGPYVGTIIGLIYTSFFLYIASRVLRDFGSIMITTILHETPLSAINIFIVITVVFACYLGVEVLSRMSEIFFPYVILFGGLLLSFIYISGLPETKNLKPVLAKGLTPILKATFPEIIAFPYGELIVFLMLIPFVNQSKLVKKTGLLAIITSSLILITVNMTIIAVLGADQALRSVVPLVDALGRVNIGNFIQRVEPLALIVLMVCGYFKISIFFYAAYSGLNELTKSRFNKKLLPPLGIILCLLSFFIAEDWISHIYIGTEFIIKYVHLPIAIFFPILFASFLFIKNKFKTKKQHDL